MTTISILLNAATELKQASVSILKLYLLIQVIVGHLLNVPSFWSIDSAPKLTVLCSLYFEVRRRIFLAKTSIIVTNALGSA